VAIGDEVKEFAVGDKVALEVGVPCERCELCVKKVRYNLCKHMEFRSSARNFPHCQGTLQERINHPHKWCHKLPLGLSFDLGALLEPISVALHAIKRSQLPKEASVLIFGAGAIGLLCACMAKYFGAGRVVIADINEGRLEFAVERKFADQAHLVPLKVAHTIEERLAIAESTAADIKNLSPPDDHSDGAFDVVFECTGTESCVQASIHATKPGGRVMLIGMGNPTQTLPLSTAALREIDLCGVFRYANTYGTGIKLLEDQRVDLLHGKLSVLPDLTSLITHRFQRLDQAKAAFEMASKAKDSGGNLVLKVFVELGESEETVTVAQEGNSHGKTQEADKFSVAEETNEEI
jgi:L-iditol 2-dehydrogenase